MTAMTIGHTPKQLAIRRFRHHHAALISLIILITLSVCAALAPVIEHWLGLDHTKVNLFGRLQGANETHVLGTDELGRDVALRLLYGARISLFVALSTAVFSAIIGTMIGLLAGYYGGRIDNMLMRFTDAVIALPLLPFLIILAALDMTKLGISQYIIRSDYFSLYQIVFIIALFSWPVVARLVRAGALSARKTDYVRAAHAMGVSNNVIMWRHILPNIAAPIIVATTLSIGNIIILESTLSFLGLGIQPPVPSWGNMLTGAQEFIWEHPMLAIYPGLMIFVTVIAFNFLGDGLQDALDPKSDTQKKA